jgi:hypothetical protein
VKDVLRLTDLGAEVVIDPAILICFVDVFMVPLEFVAVIRKS